MLTLILLFLIPLLANFRFEFVGSVSVGEIILVAVSPLAISGMRDWLGSRAVKIMIGMLAFYLFTQMLSDVYRGSYSGDYWRGWAKISMSLFSFLVVGSLMRGNESRVVVFIMGFGLSAFINRGTTIDVDLMTTAERFKFGVGASIAYLLFLLAGWVNPRLRVLFLVLPIGLAVAAFLLNARSLAGLILITVLLGVLIPRISLYSKLLKGRVVLYVIASILASVLLFEGYKIGARQGVLGELAQEKYLYQKERTGDFNLLSGREEIYFTLPKIIQSPLIGWGSWHRDPDYVIEKILERGATSDTAKYISESSMGLVPSHSHLFGGWMEAGIGGAVFWLYALFMAGRAILLGLFNFFPKARYMVLFVLVTFVWDVFFSPYGGERRVWLGFILFIIVYVSMLHARLLASRQTLQAARQL